MQTQEIKIELFGIPRLRAGVGEFCVSIASTPCTLGDVFDEIKKAMPQLGEELFLDGQLRKEFVANISGERFTRDPNSKVASKDAILIMSSDAGG